MKKEAIWPLFLHISFCQLENHTKRQVQHGKCDQSQNSHFMILLKLYFGFYGLIITNDLSYKTV